MIKLRSIHVGESVWINPEHVKKIWDAKHNGIVGTAGIDLVGDLENELPTIVAESPEEVVRKIINYKATMIDFNNYSLGVVESLVKNDMEVYKEMQTEYERILQHAGLE